MKWFKRNKKVVQEKVVEDKVVVQEFFKKQVVRDFEKLPESRKLILKGVAYGFKTSLKNLASIPFDIYLVTEEKLMEFKQDFGTKNKEEKHNRYVEWMAYFGLDYDKDRKVVQTMIRGIYEYTNKELDYRNSRMRNEVSYEQKRTAAKRKENEKSKIV